MKVSEDTAKLMTEQQKLDLPRLESRLLNDFGFIMCSTGKSKVRVYEGVKYVVHASYAMAVDEAFCQPVMEAMGADGYFNGLIMGKPEVVFFFMPLFE